MSVQSISASLFGVGRVLFKQKALKEPFISFDDQTSPGAHKTIRENLAGPATVSTHAQTDRNDVIRRLDIVRGGLRIAMTTIRKMKRQQK